LVVIKDVTTGGKTIKLDVDDPNFAKIKTGDTVTGTGIAANTAITAIQSNSSVINYIRRYDFIIGFNCFYISARINSR